MLHPQAQALLQLMIDRQIPRVHTLEPQEARAGYRNRCHLTQPPKPPVAESRDLQAVVGDGRRLGLRLIRPQAAAPNTPLPALVYLHGGGWVIGDLDTHDTLCRELANGAGCAVVSVDYRLAPEHRFPAAVDDTLAALAWVHAQAPALGLDATRLAVGGDSAGGNLAAVAALALLEDPAKSALAQALRLQMLIYPATDMGQRSDSHARNGQGYLLDREAMDYYRRHYMGPSATPVAFDDWRASPLLHPALDPSGAADPDPVEATRAIRNTAALKGLAPALIITAGHDPLCDEGAEYAQRLSRVGVPCRLVSFPRQIHGFVLMGGVLDEAHDAVALCADGLRRAFA